MSDNLTLAQACELIGRSQGWLRAKCRDGEIKATKNGRVWSIPKKEALRLAKETKSIKRGMGSPRHPWYNKSDRKPIDPNSLRQSGKVTHIYFPCTPEHGSKLKEILTAEERLLILDAFAELKQNNKSIMQVLSSLQRQAAN